MAGPVAASLARNAEVRGPSAGVSGGVGSPASAAWVSCTSGSPSHSCSAACCVRSCQSFAAVGELAMILPLPVPPGAGEDAVRFIDLSRYPSLFVDLERAFVLPPPKLRHAFLGFVPRPATLVVHDVGDFEASYVPTLADFARLDGRFRLPRALWGRLPAYADYGFAVFKLKGGGEATKTEVPPMALELPTRSPERTFFPPCTSTTARCTRAAFDHALYVQGSRTAGSTPGWQPAQRPVDTFVDVARTQGLVLGDAPCRRPPSAT